jgi:hypothetical protein
VASMMAQAVKVERTIRVLEHHRNDRPDEAGLRADRSGGSHQHHCAHPG